MIDTRPLDNLTKEIQNLFGKMLINFEAFHIEEETVIDGGFPRTIIDYRYVGKHKMMFVLSLKRGMTELERVSYHDLLDLFVQKSLFAVI